MKKMMLLFLLTALAGSSALAHGPNSIEASYNRDDQVLTVLVKHGVSSPQSHYVKQVQILRGEEVLLTQKFNSQFDNEKQVVLVLLPNLNGQIELKIKADCNRFGSREETYKFDLLEPDEQTEQ